MGTFDYTNAHEMEEVDGYGLSDDEGVIVYWEGSGSGPPLSPAPEGSFYTDRDTGIEYKQIGDGVANEWRVQVGSDRHGGINTIDAGTTVEVLEQRNMVSYGLCIDGELQVEGYQVIEE